MIVQASGIPGRIRRSSVVGALLAFGVCCSASGVAENYMPTIGAHEARVMVLAAPKELQLLSQRMALAARENPSWFMAYAKQHDGKAGRLPYDPRLGLTKAQYDRMGELIGQIELQEVEQSQILVKSQADGGISLTAHGRASYLNGVVVYPEKGYAQTRHGRVSVETKIDQQDASAPTGRWRGVQWSNGRDGIPNVKIAFGRRQQGDKVIYYDVTPSEDETVFLLYK